MIPNAHRMLNFDLGETADAIRETVHAFSQNEIEVEHPMGVGDHGRLPAN